MGNKNELTQEEKNNVTFELETLNDLVKGLDADKMTGEDIVNITESLLKVGMALDKTNDTSFLMDNKYNLLELTNTVSRFNRQFDDIGEDDYLKKFGQNLNVAVKSLNAIVGVDEHNNKREEKQNAQKDIDKMVKAYGTFVESVGKEVGIMESIAGTFNKNLKKLSSFNLTESMDRAGSRSVVGMNGVAEWIGEGFRAAWDGIKNLYDHTHDSVNSRSSSELKDKRESITATWKNMNFDHKEIDEKVKESKRNRLSVTHDDIEKMNQNTQTLKKENTKIIEQTSEKRPSFKKESSQNLLGG